MNDRSKSDKKAVNHRMILLTYTNVASLLLVAVLVCQAAEFHVASNGSDDKLSAK